jgi:hypothetical protein
MFVPNGKGAEMDEFNGFGIKQRALHPVKKGVYQGRATILRIAEVFIHHLRQFLSGQIILIHIILL